MRSVRLVLMSGGSGKRLWPMSSDVRSKQFLRILRDDSSESISMLQRIWSQLGKAELQEITHICAARSQLEIIEEQVGSAEFIEEPSRRDTFPAVSLATLFLSEVLGVSDEEIVVIMPIDSHVEDGFFSQLYDLPTVLADSGADFVLMGVRPSEPTSKYGYIRLADSRFLLSGQTKWVMVESFVEKPRRVEAQRLISEGALWNCGVFCFRVGYLKKLLQEKGIPTSYEKFSEQFESLPKKSFDYEVVEKAHSIAVCHYEGMWGDLGTWGTLSKQITDDFIGKGKQYECKNTHVINELGIPLVAMGLHNVMIVSTPDGILVADKDISANIKDVVGSFKGRPMFEERRWGSYRVMDYQKLSDGMEVLMRWIELHPGHNLSYHKHERRAEMWTVIGGIGEVILNGIITRVLPGDVIRIHQEQWHAIRAEDKLVFIEVQRGAEISEADIERQFHTWEQIVDHFSTANISASQ